jgi:hypothetical protein
LEKNPDKKGNPQRHKTHTITPVLKLLVLKNLKLLRKSWNLSILWIITPEIIKRAALNKAWHNRWKKQKNTKPWLRENIMNPNWLKVEKAIIFFMSHSKLAQIPAINIVVNDNTNNKLLIIKTTPLKRSKRKIPAVTKVEEWTKEETGVGAAIAAGSHEEKGIWALLVIAVNKIIADRSHE